MGPSNPDAVSPLLCMHMPKPITIQGCNVGCLDKPIVNPTTISTAGTLSIQANYTDRPLPSPTVSSRETPHHRIRYIDPTRANVVPVISACGRLMLDESGTLDLTNVTGRCMVSIGRPLDEVIHIKVESSSLNCSKREYVAFFDRMSFVRRCEQATGSVLITRTNVLLIRQNLLRKGNGVILKYTSQKNVKKNYHQGKVSARMMADYNSIMLFTFCHLQIVTCSCLLQLGYLRTPPPCSPIRRAGFSSMLLPR